MPKYARSLVVVLFLIAVYVADLVATHAVFTSRFPGANDFYARWAGARAWWMQGLSPYSEEASSQTQIGIYGRRALPGEDPASFAYPFYTVFLIAPLAFMPYAWAEAAWLALLQFALIGGILESIRLIKWHIPPVLLGVTLISMVFFYHSARAILLGQFAVIVFALVAGMLLALQARRDLWAGVLLALATVKPQMVFLLVPLVLLWAVAARRWRAVWGFVGALFILSVASWIVLPSWLGDFITQMMRYPSYTAIGSPAWIVTRYFFPILGTPGEILVSLALFAWAVVTWWQLWRRPTWPALVWTVSFTLIITNLIALRTATTNYVVLFIPLIALLALLQTRWKRAGAWAVAGTEVVLLVGLWVLFWVTVKAKFEHPIMYLPLPVGLLIAWLTARRWLVEEAAV